MKILLVEDDEYTSQLIATTLFAHRYAVDVVADGAAALELATRWSYDLILLDVMLPQCNGIEVCRRLRAQGCETPILILTTKNANEDVVAGLDAGADDYVAKSCHSSQLLARVRALLRRRGTTASPILKWGPLCLNPALTQVTHNQQQLALRPKEYNLLELFLRHPQRVLSRSAIIDHLWAIDETPVEGSVTNLIKDLRQRLKAAGMNAELIETVYGLGYRLNPEPVENKTEKENAAIIKLSISENGLALNQETRMQSGKTEIQKISERFRTSLEQRIAVLEQAEQALQAGSVSLEQRQTAQLEAHKLAGGLGTFGQSKASEVAQAIESVLEDYTSQEAELADQLAQLLQQLQQELDRSLAGSSL
jgi:DNA-binding response OmpR family regulator/HPt (histidine-containing phosphotransfer) domain-containing protein